MRQDCLTLGSDLTDRSRKPHQKQGVFCWGHGMGLPQLRGGQTGRSSSPPGHRAGFSSGATLGEFSPGSRAWYLSVQVTPVSITWEQMCLLSVDSLRISQTLQAGLSNITPAGLRNQPSMFPQVPNQTQKDVPEPVLPLPGHQGPLSRTLLFSQQQRAPPCSSEGSA